MYNFNYKNNIEMAYFNDLESGFLTKSTLMNNNSQMMKKYVQADFP